MSRIGQLAIQSLTEHIAYERGEGPGRTTVVSANQATVDAPPAWTAERIRAVRERMRLSQQLFAETLGVDAATVKAWEQGKRVPAGASSRLLEMAETHPNFLLEKIHLRDAEVIAYDEIAVG